MIKVKLKALIPFFIFIALAAAAGAGINRALVTSKTPLVDPAHPKVVSGDLPLVTMYSTDWCSYCKSARVFFKRKKVPFVELDIEKNSMANQDYKRLRGSGVPLITINKVKLQGFDKTQFKNVYLSELSK